MQDPKTGFVLPEDLLNEAFMTKESETPRAKTSARRVQANRRLPQKSALTVDLNYMMLIRKGIKTPDQLRWVLGGVWDEVPAVELPEATLEAVLALLQAVGEDAHRLCDDCRKEGLTPRADMELVPSEAFLRKLLLECGSIDVLVTRVKNALYMSRFPLKATALQSELDAVLDAIWAVLHSKTIPVLLQGVLLLGNYVNSSSRALGGAVGVTLESLAKLAYTQCRPPREAKESSGGGRRKRQENALNMLVQHIERGRPSFTENLSSDLEGCRIARNFDQKQVEHAVQDLGVQVEAVGRLLQETLEDNQAIPKALGPQRLREFLEKARPGIQTLQGLRAEATEAVSTLRRWLAEPPETTLTHMLANLATIREALPASGAPVARRPDNTFTPPPQPPPTAVRRQSDVTVTGTGAQSCISTTASEGPNDDDKLSVDLTTPRGDPATRLRSPSVDYIEGTCGAPFRLLARIQHEGQGAVFLSWVFDWRTAPAELQTCPNGVMRFEVVCRDQSVSWNFAERRLCLESPVELQIPLGAVYEFQVRAVFAEADEAESCAQTGEAVLPLWASPYSTPAVCDLVVREPLTAVVAANDGQAPGVEPGDTGAKGGSMSLDKVDVVQQDFCCVQGGRKDGSVLDWWAGTLSLDGEFMKDVLYLLCARRDPPNFGDDFSPLPKRSSHISFEEQAARDHWSGPQRSRGGYGPPSASAPAGSHER